MSTGETTSTSSVYKAEAKPIPVNRRCFVPVDSGLGILRLPLKGGRSYKVMPDGSYRRVRA